MFKQILVWLVVALIWGAIIYYAQAITEMFGSVAWFEKNIWSTKSGYVLMWFGIVVLGFLMVFGVVPLTSQIDSVWSIDTGN